MLIEGTLCESKLGEQYKGLVPRCRAMRASDIEVEAKNALNIRQGQSMNEHV